MKSSGVWRIQAGSSMSGSGVSKYGCVLSNSGTSGNTSVGWREPRNFRHLRGREEDKTVIRSSMDGFCEDKTQDTRQDNTFRTVIVWCHSHWTLQLACLNILFLHAGLHKNYRTEQISLDGWWISAQNRPNWLLVLIQINKERSRSYFSLSLKLWDQMFFFTLVPSLRHPRFCCIHFGNPKLKFYSSTWSSQKVLSQKIISHTHRARESLTSRQSCDRSDICWGSSAAPAEPAGCIL